jgi:hypothetical protein
MKRLLLLLAVAAAGLTGCVVAPVDYGYHRPRSVVVAPVVVPPPVVVVRPGHGDWRHDRPWRRYGRD